MFIYAVRENNQEKKGNVYLCCERKQSRITVMVVRSFERYRR